MNRHFVTSKGTDLPLLNLRGQDYLEVKYRLVWFREEHPTWTIETNFVSADERSAFARAVIRDDLGRIIATSHKAETIKGFPDFMEKAETGAIGRALALIGYGTQFCADELSEGERIVDSPVKRAEAYETRQADYEKQPKAIEAKKTESVNGPHAESGFTLDTYRVGFGKFRGKKIVDIPRKDVESYLVWLKKEAAKKNSALSVEAAIFNRMSEVYFDKLDAAAVKEAPEAVAEEASAETVEHHVHKAS